MSKISELFEQMIRLILGVITGKSVGYKPTLTTGCDAVGYDSNSPNLESDIKDNNLRVANPQGLKASFAMKRGLLLLAILLATFSVAKSTVLRIIESPEDGTSISKLSKVSLIFNLDEVKDSHPELSNLGVASASKKNTSNPTLETAVKLYKGTRENGELIVEQFESRTPTSDSFEIGNVFNIYFEDIELENNSLYTLYIYYTFYASEANNPDADLKKETRVYYTYDEPYIVSFYGGESSHMEYCEMISTMPLAESYADSFSTVRVEFDKMIENVISEGMRLCRN